MSIPEEAYARGSRASSLPGSLENGELSVERATKATWYGHADP